MPGGKKRHSFGAIKVQPPKRRAVAPAPKKQAQFGDLKPEARQQGHSVMHPNCYAKCKGQIVPGPMWIHSPGCPYTVVLWRAHGKTKADWSCAYQCEPQEIPSGWTHAHTCPFWNATGETPIGLRRPSGSASSADETPGAEDRVH